MAASPTISDIARKLGHDWRQLATCMGYSFVQLEHLEEIYICRPIERNIVFLSKWQHEVQAKEIDSMKLLSLHLREIGYTSIAETLTSSFSTYHGGITDVQNENGDQLREAIQRISFDLQEFHRSDFIGGKMKRIMKCPLCSKRFECPKQLNCGHTICRKCLRSMLEKKEKPCPVCENLIKLNNEEDVDRSFPENLLIVDLLELNEKYIVWPFADTPYEKCGSCKERQSVDFCVDCKIYLCGVCLNVHSKLPITQSHTTHQINSDTIPIIELRKKIPLCNKHNKRITSFCKNCETGVCEDCRQACSDGHIFEDLKIHCEEKRKEIKNTVEKSEQRLMEFSELLKAYEERGEKLTQEKDTALEELDSILSTSKCCLEIEINKLKLKVDDKYRSISKQIDSERDSILHDRLRLSRRTDYLKILSEYGSDAHIVTDSNENYEAIMKKETKPSLENLKKCQVQFRGNPRLVQLISELDYGMVVDEYSSDELDSRHLKTHHSHDEKDDGNFLDFSVSSCNEHGTENTVLYERAMPSQQSCLPSPPPFRPPSPPQGDHKEAFYYPTYDDAENANGQQSSYEANFSVSINSEGTKGNLTGFELLGPLDFNVRVSDTLIIGMDASGEDIALVSCDSKRIFIFDFKGECRKLTKIGAPFDAVFSKDTDNVTALYYTDTALVGPKKKKHGMVRILYNLRGKLRQENFTSETEEPRGLSANDHHIFVCDISKRRVLVFKKDGSPASSIDLIETPLYVASMGHSQLLVTDQESNTVYELYVEEEKYKTRRKFLRPEFPFLQPGKCCMNTGGEIFIPDVKRQMVFGSVDNIQEDFKDGPIAVSILSPSVKVVAMINGKVVFLKA